MSSTVSSHSPRGIHVAGTTMRAQRSWLRWPAAMTLIVAGAVHIPVTPMHLEEAPYIGYLFIVLTVACFVLAIAIVVFDSAQVWLAAGMVTALAVIAYVLSRTVGLPQIGDDVGNWLEPLGVVAIIAEAATVALSAWVLTALARTAAHPAHQH